jgi:hypothetical protein
MSNGKVHIHKKTRSMSDEKLEAQKLINLINYAIQKKIIK